MSVLPPDLEVVHQPARLRLLGLLYRQRDVSFTRTRDVLGLTDGNLATHARRLEAAGYLAARRALAGDRFEVRYRITEAGSQAFRDYLAWLQRLVADAGAAEGDTSAPIPPPSSAGSPTVD